MNDYIARFTKMVEGLKNHPKIQVTHFHTFPPATEEEILLAEKKVGTTLHDSITSFHRQSNGLQLIWIFKSNEQFDETEHYLHNQPTDFHRQYNNYYPEDGAIMIQPIQSAFSYDWKEMIYFDFMSDNEKEIFINKEYGLLEFSQKIQPFDCFSKFYDMAFFLDGTGNPPVIMGDDHQACYTDSRVTDFESYMEFVLANKGAIDRRSGFYSKYAGHKEDMISTPHDYWTKDKILEVDTLLLKDVLPEVDKAGSSTASLNTTLMQQISFGSKPLTITQLRAMIKNHHLFLGSGGAGGTWQTVHVSGLVLGIYSGPKHKEGEQANFDRKHIPVRLDLVDVDLPFGNFCGCYAKRVDFSESNLSNSLFTDAVLEEAIFADANLSSVDFSRANLKNASFMNANLMGADFENCDLTGADFRGANLEGSRFPGAIVKEVKV